MESRRDLRIAAQSALLAVLGLALAACSGTRLTDGQPSFRASKSVSASKSFSASQSDSIAATSDSIATEVEPTSARYGLATLPAFGSASDGGCGLPCESGTQQWHVRAVFGRSFFSGTENPDDDNYFGFDIGRNLCDSCWSIDGFFRRHGGQMDRMTVTQVPGAAAITTNGKEDGYINHVGLKFAFQGSFTNSNLYWWAGLGPGYFWTEDYTSDDEGFGLYGEIGLGYNLSPNWRIRLGVNLHGFDTDVTRIDPMTDGQSRFLLGMAPVIQIEGSF